MTLTVTDLFCGAGGSSLGAEAVPGVKLAMAANHWPKAIEVHQRGFPDAAHDCADISQVDFRRYRGSDILIASPECTNHSASKGVSRRRQQPDLFAGPDPGAERSRATMWDVHRYIEVHRPAVVIVENVVDARSWVYWETWWRAFADVGYTARLLSLNSMHTGAVPQSRDRIYVVATRRGLNPDLDLRPAAWCPTCESQVEARQVFKRLDRQWGRYRQQYLWRCPVCATAVEPPVLAAATAIDWALPARRIGERTRPLAAATMRRIRLGIQRYGITVEPAVCHSVAWPPLIAELHGGRSTARPASRPLATVEASGNHHGLVCPPFLVQAAHGAVYPAGAVHEDSRVRTAGDPLWTVCAGGNGPTLVCPPLIVQPAHAGDDAARVRPAGQPLATVTASDDRQLLIQPPSAFYVKGYTQRSATSDGGMVRPVSDPLGTISTIDHHGLLVPYYRTGTPSPVGEPAPTVTTHDRHGLLHLEVDLDDCTFRMLEPHEIGAAMAFPATYLVDGTKRDRIRLYGNAVTPPVMELLVRPCVAALMAA